MATPPAEGLFVRYQGYTCSPIHEFTRSAGPEPDFGYVHISRSDYGKLSVAESLPGLDSPTSPATATTQDKSAPPLNGFVSSGLLEIIEVIDGVTHATRFEKTLVSERAAEVPFAVDYDGSELVRLELTDIRLLWRTRGLLFGWVNVPKIPAGSTPSGGTQEKPGTGDAAAGVATQYIPGSLRNGTDIYTVRQALEEKILPALPLAPKIKRFPILVGAAGVCPGYVWSGMRPKEALVKLLEDRRLVITLNLDSTVSFWKEGEGALQDDQGKLIPLGDHETGVGIDDRVSNARDLVGFHYVPTAVVVVGPPIIQNVRMNLEPVGEIGGTVLPLNDFLTAIGLDDAKARRFAMLTHKDRSVFLGVAEGGLKLFERCAYKWFRVPGLPASSSDLLPIGPRGIADSIGQMLPPRVWADGHTMVNMAASALAKIPDATNGQQPIVFQTKDAKQSADLKAILNQSIKQSLKQLDAIEAAGIDALRIWLDLPFAEQTSGYSIDTEHGVVMFESIVGPLEQNSALVLKTPRVQIEYGYTKKPAQNGDLKLEHRYHSVWIRNTKGVVSDVNRANPVAAPAITQAPTIAPGLCPFAIFRPELQQVNGIDGTTNQKALDAIAKDLALEVLSRPQQTAGAVVQLHRPVPVACTGKVLSVVWSAERGVPRVVAHVGTYGPLTPPPDLSLRTRAFGEQSATVDSVFVPPALRSPR